jgi:hypothetical protein
LRQPDKRTSFDDAAHLVAAFGQGLKEAGFIEGQNVAIEYRSAEDQADRLPMLVADIVDDGIALDYDAASIGIDLDLGDLAAVGEVFRNVAQTFTRGVSRKARPDRR